MQEQSCLCRTSTAFEGLTPNVLVKFHVLDMKRVGTCCEQLSMCTLSISSYALGANHCLGTRKQMMSHEHSLNRPVIS